MCKTDRCVLCTRVREGCVCEGGGCVSEVCKGGWVWQAGRYLGEW